MSCFLVLFSVFSIFLPCTAFNFRLWHCIENEKTMKKLKVYLTLLFLISFWFMQIFVQKKTLISITRKQCFFYLWLPFSSPCDTSFFCLHYGFGELESFHNEPLNHRTISNKRKSIIFWIKKNFKKGRNNITIICYLNHYLVWIHRGNILFKFLTFVEWGSWDENLPPLFCQLEVFILINQNMEINSSLSSQCPLLDS